MQEYLSKTFCAWWPRYRYNAFSCSSRLIGQPWTEISSTAANNSTQHTGHPQMGTRYHLIWPGPQHKMNPSSLKQTPTPTQPYPHYRIRVSGGMSSMRMSILNSTQPPGRQQEQHHTLCSSLQGFSSPTEHPFPPHKIAPITPRSDPMQRQCNSNLMSTSQRG
jgi:hypothetical protein